MGAIDDRSMHLYALHHQLKLPRVDAWDQRDAFRWSCLLEWSATVKVQHQTQEPVSSRVYVSSVVHFVRHPPFSNLTSSTCPDPRRGTHRPSREDMYGGALSPPTREIGERAAVGVLPPAGVHQVTTGTRSRARQTDARGGARRGTRVLRGEGRINGGETRGTMSVRGRERGMRIGSGTMRWPREMR